MDIPADLSTFLTFMASPVFGAWVISEVLEQAQWFQLLPSGRKSLVVLVVMLLLSITSFALVRWVPPSVVANLQPLYAVIAGTIAAFLSGKLYHEKTHNPSATTSAAKAATAAINAVKADPPLSGAPVPAA